VIAAIRDSLHEGRGDHLAGLAKPRKLAGIAWIKVDRELGDTQILSAAGTKSSCLGGSGYRAGITEGHAAKT
jgi:hypothetical protein